uniref:Ovule protein n=1 Tax=Gongylonema pulchrum TaxID=637853 RepID=A0A183EYU9_9BILA
LWKLYVIKWPNHWIPIQHLCILKASDLMHRISKSRNHHNAIVNVVHHSLP